MGFELGACLVWILSSVKKRDQSLRERLANVLQPHSPLDADSISSVSEEKSSSSRGQGIDVNHTLLKRPRDEAKSNAVQSEQSHHPSKRQRLETQAEGRNNNPVRFRIVFRRFLSILDLPPEMLTLICRSLNIVDQVAFQRTSKRFSSIIPGNLLPEHWQSLWLIQGGAVLSQDFRYLFCQILRNGIHLLQPQPIYLASDLTPPTIRVHWEFPQALISLRVHIQNGLETPRSPGGMNDDTHTIVFFPSSMLYRVQWATKVTLTDCELMEVPDGFYPSRTMVGFSFDDLNFTLDPDELTERYQVYLML